MDFMENKEFFRYENIYVKELGNFQFANFRGGNTQPADI